MLFGYRNSILVCSDRNFPSWMNIQVPCTSHVHAIKYGPDLLYTCDACDSLVNPSSSRVAASSTGLELNSCR